MAASKTKTSSYIKRLESLRKERSEYMPLWGELSDYHLHHRGKFLVTKQSIRRNTKVYNNTSRLALRTLASGMMAGITSPARPWFKLAASNDAMNEVAGVKDWLHQVEITMQRVFAKSNTYNSLHSLYTELGAFGTAAMGIFENYDDVIRCKTFTVGSYMLALSGDDRVDTFYREYQRTVGQLVKQFGIDNVSNDVKRRWENGDTETMVTVLHCVEPNDDRDEMSPLARDFPVRSVYMEVGKGREQQDEFLLESGFMDFPILCPRWDVVDDEAYARACPGIDTIGDTKALQLGEKRKYQALDKLSDPPMYGPENLREQMTGSRPSPGDFYFMQGIDGAVKSVYEGYQPRLDYIQAIQQEVELRIKRGFYEDLFLMLANSDRRQITAREVAEKHEEKLLMLGPVLERLHAELLDPLIDRTFNILARAGILPAPPQELVDSELKVEYVSVLAQAQRMVGISGIERTIGFTMGLVNIWPEARHKIDAMQAVDEYASAAGVNPRLIRGDDEATQIAQAEAQAAQQQQAEAQAAQQVQNAKTLSDTNTQDENALTDTLRNAGLM